MRAVSSSISLAFTSDPQYPWYDEILPTGLTTEEEIKLNSQRQIMQLYASLNDLAKERRDGPHPLEGVVINGDLTAFGHSDQLSMYETMLQTLEPPYYPGLGNHDYSNNVHDCYNDDCATRMVNFMYSWIKRNGEICNYDFADESYYKFPELRTDFSGSLSYAFDLGSIHLVQLQNFPSYKNEWNSWNTGAARRDFFYIHPSFHWLRNDLARARNPGQVIIVNVHDYGDDFIEPYLSEFDDLMNRYGVSAVFAGHIHRDCKKVRTIQGTDIPVFRSGSASYQDCLIADLDTEAKTMVVKVWECPENGTYGFTGEEWSSTLNDSKPSPPLPVPPTEGYVTFFNEGGFVAWFRLQYTVDGQEFDIKTGDMALGNKKTYDIPPYATRVKLNGQEQTGLVWEGWRTVFNLEFDSPPNKCFKLYGTTLFPKWNNSCD